jgi:hypothetical protein
MATESEGFAGEGFSVLVQVAIGYRADEGHSTSSQLISSRVVPQLKRAVFVAEGRNWFAAS